MSVNQRPLAVRTIIGSKYVFLLSGLIVPVCRAEPANEYRVIVISERSVKARLLVEAETALQPREWLLAAPQPPQLERQTNITAKLSPSGKSGRELSSQRRPVLVSRLKDSSRRLNIAVEYTMTLLARSLVQRREGDETPVVPALSNSERALSLLTSPLCAYREREFQRWLDEHELRRKDDETIVDFGRRVFEFMRTQFQYEFLIELDRRVMHVCREKKSDCLGLCVLYVSIMRANEIPARILVGRWARSAVAGEKLGEAEYSQEHVKCEFYAPDVGWIPVDPATALLQEREHVSKRQFGLDTADFITMHVNDQLLLQTASNQRRTVSFLQGVFVSVFGEGRSNEIRLRSTWYVEPP